jgi:hypothetical protein
VFLSQNKIVIFGTLCVSREVSERFCLPESLNAKQQFPKKKCPVI